MATSKRRLSTTAAALAAAVLALAACSSGATSEPPSTPMDGGKATFALSSPPDSFDPNISASAEDARVLRQLYDSLVDLGPDGELSPWLAESWSVSDDGVTYEFTLRDGVTFHDGTPLDAAAVCYNFDRITNPDTGSLYAVSLVGPVESCEATDATTVVVTLTEPFTPFLANLSTPFLGMVSPTAAEASGVEGFGQAPVGSGPFALESYTPSSEVRLVRNEDYDWASATAEHEGPAHLDALTFQVITDATVRLGSLRSGDVQAISDVPAQEVAAIEQDETLDYYDQTQGGAVFQLFLNTTRPLLKDPAVRRAVVSALDLDGAVEATYFGVYDRAQAPMSPTTPGYDESISPLPFDAEQAADDLTAAGWVLGEDGIREKDGERLELVQMEPAPSYDRRRELAEFLRQNLKDIGVDVEIVGETAAQVAETYSTGSYDIASTSFVAVDADILSTIYSSTSYFDVAKVDSLDAQLEAAQQAPAGPERDALYGDIQRTAIEEAYSIPVYVLNYRVAAQSNLQGISFDAAAYPKFYDAFLSQ